MRLVGFTLMMDKASRERGPIRSILRMWEGQRKRLLEGGCSTEERLLIERGIL
jgi:hypothetical protein